ncbi:hypothetical protein CGCA056_v000165 [Colletotrichum aenigma]|uniref:uncharacterized protein n=1 Tax=Colletotrichum aenigma TaxID=1215731 RepID=UPI001872CF87|nr:uncharacterized protein CGCA056_v000165 [Colletotrichum aenigma]KAF5528478.1 hypothetical protein CGCA056_v000165 [Colletotrichum aenigma]
MRRVNVGHNVFRWRRPARGFAFTPGRNRIIHPAFAHRPEAWAEPKPQPQRAATPLPKVEQKVAPEAPEKKELTKEQLRQFMAHQEAREQEAKRRQRARRTKAKVTWVAVRRNAPAWATRRFEIRQWGAEVFRAKMMAREEALAIAAPDVWKEAAEARQEISKQDVRKAAREAARKAARKASSRAAHKARQDRKERRARNELRNELRARRKLIAATGARPPVSSRIRAGHLKTAPEDIRRRNSIRTWKDIVGADIEAENPRGSSKPFTRLEVRHIQPYDGFVTKTDYEVVSDWNTRRRPGEPLLLRVPGRAPLFSPPPTPPTVPPDGLQTPQPKVVKNNSLLTQMLLAARYMARYQGKRISLDDVDIIATRNVLEHLIFFCTNVEARLVRLNLYMVGRSLHVMRPPTEGTDSGAVPIAGFGRNYEKAVTVLPRSLQDSPDHLRNIKYKIGDVTCLVQTQVDAYCGEDAGYLGKTTYKKTYDNGDIVIETAGAGYAEPPRDGMAEIKTQSRFKPEEEQKHRQAEDFRQAWVGRVTHMINARQIYGVFDEAEVVPTAGYLRDWEDANQLALRRLVTLLKDMRKRVMRNDGRNCAVLLRGNSEMNRILFYETVDQEPTAPDELISEFWTGKKTPPATPEARKEKQRARRRQRSTGLSNDKRTLALRKKLKMIHQTFRKYVSSPEEVSAAPADHRKPAIAQTRPSKPTTDTSKTDADKKSGTVAGRKVLQSQQNGKPAPKKTKPTPANGPAGGQMNAVTTTSGKAKRPSVPIKADWGQRNVALAEKKTRHADAAKMAKAKPAVRAFKPQAPRPKPAADDGWGAAFGPVPGAGPRR